MRCVVYPVSGGTSLAVRCASFLRLAVVPLHIPPLRTRLVGAVWSALSTHVDEHDY